MKNIIKQKKIVAVASVAFIYKCPNNIFCILRTSSFIINHEMLRNIVTAILLISVISAPDLTKLIDIFIEAINLRAFPGATVIVAN